MHLTRRIAAPPLALLICLAALTFSRAQTPPAARNPFDYIRYDPAGRGPLLLVSKPLPPGSYSFTLTPDGGGQIEKTALATFAERTARRIVRAGSLTVLAPKTMKVIVEQPGRPDPYAGLRADERFKFLLSLLSKDQWRQAGSARGIGPEDMTDEQRALFVGLLPEKILVHQTKLMPTDKPNVRVYEPQSEPQEMDASTARLRLGREIRFRFKKLGAEDYSYGGGPEGGAEETITRLQNDSPRGDAPPEQQNNTTFGVPIFKTVPSRLKSGDLNFTAPALDAPVALGGEAKTLGTLLARVARTTGLELVADRRVAGLMVYLRAVEGQRARAGDILQALCWSVTGAFRRVGASTYLLTDDVQGIGSRFARLEEWAEAADAERYKAMQGLTDKASKQDPLAYLSFLPGDPFALTPEQLQRVDTEYRKARYKPAPDFALSELSPAIQASINRFVERQQENGIALRTDRVRIDTQLRAQWVFPGDVAVEPMFAANFEPQYLQAVVPEKPKPAVTVASPKQEPPKPMSASLKKRVLLAQLPPDNAATTGLLAAAKAKGFTEIWLHVPLDDPEAAAKRLTAAVARGKRSGLLIGAAVSLLRGGGMPGVEDVNILGETGAQLAQRRAATPHANWYYGRSAGWIVPDASEAARRLVPLARVPGLSALTLRASAAPGWAGHTSGGDGIPRNGHLGYTLALRLACIRAEGFDPIDVTDYSHVLNVDERLPFFPFGGGTGLWQSLNNFRLGENKKMLAAVHAALRQAAPRLTLYLDDRASAYATPHTSWYGRWDAPERVPINPVFHVESMAREAAFQASSEPLRNQLGRSGKPEDLARRVGETAEKASKNWRGLTLDLVGLAPPEALRMLGGLPETPAR